MALPEAEPTKFLFITYPKPYRTAVLRKAGEGEESLALGMCSGSGGIVTRVGA